MLPEVKIKTIRKATIKTKWVADTAKDADPGDGELVTTITIDAVLEPAEIGELAYAVRNPESAAATIGSIQHIMALAREA